MKKSIYLLAVFIGIFFSFSSLISYASYTEDVSDTIVVGVTPDRCPMFYTDTEGNLTGIGIDLMNSAAKSASINVEYRAITEPSLKQALDNPNYDLVLPFGSPITSAKGNDSIVSDNFINMPFTFVTLKEKNLTEVDKVVVGMLSSQKGVAETIKEMYPNMTILYYDTVSECVSSLRLGYVDALLNNAYIWSYVLQKPSYSDLVELTTNLFTVDFRVGALDTEESRILIEKLNEGIASITDTERQAIVLDYTSRKLYKYTFDDYVYTVGPFVFFIALIFGVVILSFVVRHKVTQIKNEEYVTQLINKDSLTGAYSMTGFRDRVEEILRNKPNHRYVILYINIRDFKYINNNFGLKASDEMLKVMVKRIQAILHEDELVCRVESDHIVVFDKLNDIDLITKYKQEVMLPIRNYFVDKGKELIVQLCCGIYTLTEEDYTNVNVDHMIDLARVAELKVRETKKEGYEFYNPNQWQKGKWMSDVVGHLKFAIANGEIQVYYQPQVDYSSGVLIGAEALCRWNHTKLGWISPGEFVPALEDAGFISELDFYVWERVCQDLNRWNKENNRKTVSINVSRFDIKTDVDIVEYLYGLVQKYELDIDQLNIEITETAYVNNEILIDITQRFRDLGFRVEMDDFGSGYSSLNMLKEIPIDRIKLDLRFLSKDTSDERGRIIIECLIFMAKRLGIDLIAEGVETEEQANMLKELGCTSMQGYYFYKPLNVESFEKVSETT
jgi:diguanylate cyclase (GGDEF)-like protein